MSTGQGPDDAGAPEAALAALRGEIDDIDRRIHALLNARARCALRVAEVKSAALAGAEGEVAFYRPEREADVLRGVMERNDGPLPDRDVAALFREIMSCCLALEQPLTIAYLGPEGTFTEAAAIKHFGHFSRNRPFPTIDAVFREVEAGAVHYGVVPVENSTEGMVSHTLDCFMDSALAICGEVTMPIHHHLLLPPGRDPSEVKRIYSHQQSFAQCRRWLEAHWPDAEKIPLGSNAEAARRVAEAPGTAAIAGDRAAERYGLSKAAANIEDHPDNTTRFLVLGRHAVGPSGGQDKTSIVISTRNEPGALYRVLEPFSREGVDLSRIETRPSRTGPWTYVFFVDVLGHRTDPPLRRALDAVAAIAFEVRHLGSYPQCVL